MPRAAPWSAVGQRQDQTRAPLSGKDGADAQQEGHTAGLEDAPLEVPEGPPLAVEQEPSPDVLVAQKLDRGAAGRARGQRLPGERWHRERRDRQSLPRAASRPGMISWACSSLALGIPGDFESLLSVALKSVRNVYWSCPIILCLITDGPNESSILFLLVSY